MDDRFKKLEKEIQDIKQRRIYQDAIVPAAIKPRHLVKSNVNSNGGVPLSNGTDFELSNLAVLYPFITSAKYVPIFGSNLPIGDNDLYTVPQGKKLLLVGAPNAFATVYNASAGSITYYPEIKVEGVYYRLKSNVTIASAQTGIGSFIATAMVLNVGETVAVNTTTTAGLNVWATAIEFSENETIVGKRILNLVSGNNTLYTCPNNKTATFATNIFSISTSGYFSVGLSNVSGVAPTYYLNYVTNGSTPTSANQFTISTPISNNTVSGFTLGGSLTPGDSVNINTTSGTTGQMAWTTVFEI